MDKWYQPFHKRRQLERIKLHRCRYILSLRQRFGTSELPEAQPFPEKRRKAAYCPFTALMNIERRGMSGSHRRLGVFRATWAMCRSDGNDDVAGKTVRPNEKVSLLPFCLIETRPMKLRLCAGRRRRAITEATSDEQIVYFKS